MGTSPEIEVAQKLHDDPVFFCKEILGVDLWSKQKEILLSVRDNRRTGVASGHNIGKTLVAACCALWWSTTRYGSKVITTATTFQQVRENLWAEIHRLYEQAGRRVQGGLGGVMQDVAYRLDRQGWGVFGIASKNPDSFQGRHARNLLVILDEAQGVPQEIWTAAQSMISSEGCRMLAIANPIHTDGAFHDAFHTKRDMWSTFHVSCLDHPNLFVQPGQPLPYPKAITRDGVEDMRLDYGEGSPMWRSRVLGQFPEAGETTIVPIKWLNDADVAFLERGWQPAQDPEQRHMGVDLGREGTDPSVATLMDNGRMTQSEEWHDPSTMGSAGRVIELMKRWDVPAHNIHLDEEGLGGGVVDALYEAGHPVDGVKFGRGAEGDWEHITGTDTEFENRKGELYWALRQAVQRGEVSIDPALRKHWSQLTDQRYRFTGSGKIAMEKKAAVKQRTGRSPDHADSAVYAMSRRGRREILFERV